MPAMPTIPLPQLPIGQNATITQVNTAVEGADRELVLRLVEIGFLPGETVRVIAHGQPGNEPLAVRLGHTTFALRRFEAAFIHVDPVAA